MTENASHSGNSAHKVPLQRALMITAGEMIPELKRLRNDLMRHAVHLNNGRQPIYNDRLAAMAQVKWPLLLKSIELLDSVDLVNNLELAINHLHRRATDNLGPDTIAELIDEINKVIDELSIESQHREQKSVERLLAAVTKAFRILWRGMNLLAALSRVDQLGATLAAKDVLGSAREATTIVSGAAGALFDDAVTAMFADHIAAGSRSLMNELQANCSSSLLLPKHVRNLQSGEIGADMEVMSFRYMANESALLAFSLSHVVVSSSLRGSLIELGKKFVRLEEMLHDPKVASLEAIENAISDLQQMARDLPQMSSTLRRERESRAPVRQEPGEARQEPGDNVRVRQERRAGKRPEPDPEPDDQTKKAHEVLRPVPLDVVDDMHGMNPSGDGHEWSQNDPPGHKP